MKKHNLLFVMGSLPFILYSQDVNTPSFTTDTIDEEASDEEALNKINVIGYQQSYFVDTFSNSSER